MTKTAVAAPPPPSHPEASLSIRLEYGDGSSEVLPVDFDFSDLTVDQLKQIYRLKRGSILDEADPSPRFVAICIFAKLDRPDSDFEVLGPVLTDFAQAKADIEINEVD